jgi:3-oxoacyl-[acyl-carrier-protein] synthase II
MSHAEIVITGMGIISPAGTDLDTFYHTCHQAVSCAAEIPAAWRRYSSFRSTVWAPLPSIDLQQYGISRVDTMQLPRSSILGLCATRQALDHAGLHYACVDRKKQYHVLHGIDAQRAGVCIGTGVGGTTALVDNEANHVFTPLKNALNAYVPVETDTAAQHDASAATDMHTLMDMPKRFNPMVVSMVMPNACANTIGIRYGLKGTNATCSGACASGTIAIAQAYHAIEQDHADVMIAGGVEFLHDRFGGIFRGFDSAGTLAIPDEDIHTCNRPFDRARSGFLFGEGGAGIVILERLSHALRRGARPLARVCAAARSFDAYSIMSPDPGGTQMHTLFQQLLHNANIRAEDIDYINAHGTGTRANDTVEARVLLDTFGTHPLVTSTKSITGHTIGAAGAIECIASVQTLTSQSVHPCRNLEDPVAPCTFCTRSVSAPVRYALTHSFAFGGQNAALVLSRATAT